MTNCQAFNTQGRQESCEFNQPSALPDEVQQISSEKAIFYHFTPNRWGTASHEKIVLTKR